MKEPSESESRPLTKAEIEKLPPKAAVALAARCAMRVFPAIGFRGNLDFRKGDPEKHVRSIEAASLVAVLVSVGRKRGFPAEAVADAVNTAAAAAAADAHNAATAAQIAVGAAVADIYTTGDVDSYPATAARAAAAVAAAAAVRFAAALVAVRDDNAWLLNKGSKGEVASESISPDFYSRPLWKDGRIPEDWNEVLERFHKALASVGLEEVFRRHEKLLHGEGFDPDEAKRLVDEWNQKYGTEFEEISQITEPETPKEKIDETVPEARPVTETGFAPSSCGDAPATEDRLGRERLARVLAAMFSSPTQGTPFTVAILGDWGSGKSTLMNLLIEQLRIFPSAFDFKIAKFNAWQYEHSDSIPAGLAQEVVKGLTQETFPDQMEEPSWFKRFEKWIKTGFNRVCLSLKLVWQEQKGWLLVKLFTWVALFLVVIAAAIFAFNVQAGNGSDTISKITGFGAVGAAVAMLVPLIKQLKTILEHPFSTELFTYLRLPRYYKQMGQLPIIRSQLHNLCEICLKKENGREKRLVVFVDDLDRCGQQNIAETLDAIRLIVDIDNVIVVLMIDHRIALRAVAEQYKDLADSQTNKYAIARDYLGKIIQVPIRLSRPRPEKLEEFIDRDLFPSVEEGEERGETIDAKVGGAKETEESPEATVPGPPESTLSPDLESPEKPSGQSGIEPAQPPPADSGEEPATPPPSEEIELDQEQIREDMKDTKEDRELFKTLVKDYEMNNPRQLTRLRNSFRVLKGIHQTFPREPDPAEKSHRILTMLFWLEFLHDLPFEERKACGDWLGKGGHAKLDGNAQLKSIVSKAKEYFEAAFGEDALKNGGSEDFTDMKEFVNRLVLPFYDFVQEQKEKEEEAKAVQGK